MNRPQPESLPPHREEWVQAVIFDLDGVLTDTAEAHARAWKRMFDAFLETRREPPFDPDEDYRRYVDGKPRADGVRSFLQSRGIELPDGAPDDPPERETVWGLGNRKNRIFQEYLAAGQVTVYPEVARVVRDLQARSIRTAVVSSSRNCRRVLEAAGITDLFEVRVDGEVSAERGLEGKPAPDIFLAAAAELGVEPQRAVVLEDARSGVEAGRRGGFGCVVGVARAGLGRDLRAHGADRVVRDLTALDPAALPRRRSTRAIPSALEAFEGLAAWLAGHRPALFLDFDGTLSPIVDRPEKAGMSDSMRAALRDLARRGRVAVVSGRGLADVRERVGVDGIAFAGSHGFEIHLPGRPGLHSPMGDEALPALEAAERRLRERLAGVPGAQVERKRFSVAVHYRRVAPEQAEAVAEVVEAVHRRHDGLRKGTGKKVFELQPDVEWDKGRCVLWLLERLEGVAADSRAIYIGDDVTDEDAFRVLAPRGAGIVVHGGEDRPTYAAYGLTDPGEVERFLRRLTAALEGGA